MRKAFRAALPGAYFLESDNRLLLEGYLREQGWIGPVEQVVSVGRAGEGNMNLTLRVRTPQRSLILKQARPWVEKYPHIPAPDERALVEARFYEWVSTDDHLRALLPGVIGVDAKSRIQCFEDLGEARDCVDLYGEGDVSEAEEDLLLAWLGALHRLPVDRADPLLVNRKMRALNHEHMFVIPLQHHNGVDLDTITPGLAGLAAGLRSDLVLREEISDLARIYLEDGHSLLHGDFYPGSWVRVPGGIRVIDPEFAFVGPAEFDVGVFLAHFAFGRRRMVHLVAEVVRRYRGPEDFDWPLALRFAGAELLRRLLGVAQLPMKASLAQKRAWLEQGRRLVLDGHVEAWR